jgi:hypothetical protein
MSRFPKMQKFLESKGYRQLPNGRDIWAHHSRPFGFMFWLGLGDYDVDVDSNEPLECAAPVILNEITTGVRDWVVSPRLYDDRPGDDFSHYTFARMVVDHFNMERYGQSR